MYLVGYSFHVSFKWVVIISTKHESALTQSAKVVTCYTLWHFGDWSLITGRGGLQNGRGGGVKFYPYKKGRAVLAVLKGGGGDTKSFEVALTWELEVLAIVIGGFPPLKGWGARKTFYLVLTSDFPILYCGPHSVSSVFLFIILSRTTGAGAKYMV